MKDFAEYTNKLSIDEIGKVASKVNKMKMILKSPWMKLIGRTLWRVLEIGGFVIVGIEAVDKFGEASDTKLYEFIGNAMDISTTRNLLKQIFKHTENITWNEPQEHSFVRSNTVQQGLF